MALVGDRRKEDDEDNREDVLGAVKEVAMAMLLTNKLNLSHTFNLHRTTGILEGALMMDWFALVS